ncbi:MAG TPA: EamA family transporter [Bacteroidales bacterium]|nr:EamA family transporter [Bacteroidales bacterium]
MSDKTKSYLLASLAVLFWSTIATAFKIALAEISPAQLLFIASSTAVVVLAVISIIEGKFKALLLTSPANIIMSALLGLLNPFVYYLVLLKAYTLLPAQVAQPLNMIWPIVLVFLSVPMLKQRIPARSFLALFISFAGVYLISSQGQPLHPGKSDLTGVVLATGSSIFWAMYFILNLKDKRDESNKLLMNFLISTIYIAIYLIATGGFGYISIKGLLAGVYTGIFEMGLTFYIWLKALKLAETSDKISNLVFLAPFISLIFISIFLGEHIYFTTFIGLVIIIAGIIYQKTGKHR